MIGNHFPPRAYPTEATTWALSWVEGGAFHITDAGQYVADF